MHAKYPTDLSWENLGFPSVVSPPARCSVQRGGDELPLCPPTLPAMFLLGRLRSADLPPVLGVEW